MISRNISVYAILFMTANQAVLLIVYHVARKPHWPLTGNVKDGTQQVKAS